MVVNLLELVERLGEFSESGRVVPEFSDPQVREVLYRNYRVVYRVREERVEILTVFHGARLLDLPKEFEQ